MDAYRVTMSAMDGSVLSMEMFPTETDADACVESLRGNEAAVKAVGGAAIVKTEELHRGSWVETARVLLATD